MKIFVINPGSTSTKFAVYEDETIKWKGCVQHPVDELAKFEHVNDQLAYRNEAMHKLLEDNGIKPDFDAVIARGGLLKPTPGGVYRVDDKIKHDLIYAEMEHACNLGGLMADEFAASIGCPAFIADPEVVDERIPEACLSGLPGMNRKSIFHALNSKAVARRYARLNGLKYEELDLIVVHLGGGISVSAHCHGRVHDVNNALDGDGPFSPERAGTLPAADLVDLCFSGRYTQRELHKLLNGKGGLTAHLGINDVAEVVSRAEAGEEPFKGVLDSMLYNVACQVGARAVTLKGHIDAIILTGGIAHSQYCVDKLSSWIDWLAPISIRAGEDELGALAFNAYGAMTGSLPLTTYNPE
ncbi:MAG: butyrate kinase [Muribaculaceae bacterium]|nr:butyrate kinase [Muribaculaceae bacterium]